MSTPNPNFMKFIPEDTIIMKTGTLDFPDVKYATISPLAQLLFKIKGVKRVFLGKDHVSVSIQESLQWDNIQNDIIQVISDQIDNKKTLVLSNDQLEEGEDSELVQFIKEIIDKRIRPIVAEDGGDVEYKSFDLETGLLTLTMKGACAGCPSSEVTLKEGIEKMMTHYVEEVKQVVGESQEEE